MVLKCGMHSGGEREAGRSWRKSLECDSEKRMGVFKVYRKRKGILDIGPSMCKGPEINLDFQMPNVQSRVNHLTESNFIWQAVGSPEKVSNRGVTRSEEQFPYGGWDGNKTGRSTTVLLL